MIPTAGLHLDQAPPLHIPFRFFATAPLFLFLAGLALAAWGGDAMRFVLEPATIVLTHLAVLGWISMVMFGAMYQMIPVLAGLPMPWLRMAWWVHGGLIIGLVAFAGEMAFNIHPWLLLVASAGLGLALGLFLLQTGRALVRTRVVHPTINAMRGAILSLAAVLILGGAFLGEHHHGFFDVDRLTLIGIHLVLGLFGWIGLLIIGVSMQVLPMFYVTPPFSPSRGAQALTALGASLIGLSLVLALWPNQTMLLWVAGIPGLLGILLYGREIWIMLAARKRKLPDVTYHFWLLGFTSAAASLPLLALWPAFDDERLRFLFAVLFLWGWASAVIMGMLYKIIPFLVWFHRFSRLAGLVEIPMMDDLIPERAARLHFLVHTATLTLALAGIWTDADWLFQGAGAGLILSGGLLAFSLASALSHRAPPAPETPDFNSFFKDFTPPQQG